MNNQRNNSNRRRGRGNRNQGSGGGNQGNRIDSRARGNAPQMLEKYKKLAQDAQHNGDRVQAEYYLQFADHYFRVLADNRSRQDARQDEGRGPRQREERDFDDGHEDGDFDDRQRPASASASASGRRPRDRDDNRDDRGREDRGRDSRNRDDNRYESRDNERESGESNERESGESDADTRYEPAENPFLRTDSDEVRPPRRGALKPRRTEAKAAAPKGEIDAAVLPPSIGARETANDAEDEAQPAPRPKTSRSRRKAGEDGAVSAVG